MRATGRHLLIAVILALIGACAALAIISLADALYSPSSHSASFFVLLILLCHSAYISAFVFFIIAPFSGFLALLREPQARTARGYSLFITTLFALLLYGGFFMRSLSER